MDRENVKLANELEKVTRSYDTSHLESAQLSAKVASLEAELASLQNELVTTLNQVLRIYSQMKQLSFSTMMFHLCDMFTS